MLHKNLFYFDIETAGQYKSLESLMNNDRRGYELFLKKYHNNTWMSERFSTASEAYLEYSPIFSTFGKIVCISFGYFTNKNTQGYRVDSIYGDNEKKIVTEFNNLLLKVSQKHMSLSGYRILSFDIPWVLHKLNKYGIEPSKLIDVYGIKPWDIRAVDLADEWKQKFRYYVSFDEVCYTLGIDSPKDEIDGSMVHSTYWKDKNIELIKDYCQKDVLSSMKVAEKMFKFR